MAILAGVTPDSSHLTYLAHVIGEVQPSNYGVDWELRTVEDPVTPVYSDLPLRVHTDLPYRDLPPGLQFILCAQADAQGGESILVDGYRIAEEIRTTSPESWLTLTQADWTYRYADSRYDVRGGGPVLGIDRAGRYGVIRHAPGLVMPSPNKAESAPAGAAVRLFMDLAADPRFEVRERLQPGELLAFDNHRLLHGRGPIDISTGGRLLLGCYLDTCDLHSARRMNSAAVAGL